MINEGTPDDPNVTFCPMHQIDRNRGTITALRIFMTTIKLISQVEEDATNSTYKLVWNGYKVLLVGSCDRGKKFHPFGIAVTMYEKNQDFEYLFQALKETVKKLFERHIQPIVLLADGAEAIHNSFAKPITFNNRTMFKSASKFFIEKWTELNKDFASYSERTWINSSINGWFYGRSQSHPVINNALESHNKVIKDLVERKYMPLADFLKNINDAVLQFWSFQRNDIGSDLKVFSKEPNVTKDDFKRGKPSININPNININTTRKEKAWKTSKKNVKEVDNTILDVDTFKPIDKEHCKNYIQMFNQCEWNSFQHFVETFQELRFFRPKDDNWRLSTCSCPSWFNYICKHIIEIAFRESLFTEFPKEA
ncbi:hypothetical protein BpHYR1_049495 [Brachionus plicatilis]|uniref:SWIM-type domain-containing protein n=1 Tax=Brachionus plicatilis TaxID=10195 RepID=A0A3M7S8A7_BRAPC|nr:hypothetical protein BpHYR1_049495 [Brachionus plicatilis]